MAKITFYPVGNADSTLIEFDDSSSEMVLAHNVLVAYFRRFFDSLFLFFGEFMKL